MDAITIFTAIDQFIQDCDLYSIACVGQGYDICPIVAEKKTYFESDTLRRIIKHMQYFKSNNSPIVPSFGGILPSFPLSLMLDTPLCDCIDIYYTFTMEKFIPING